MTRTWTSRKPKAASSNTTTTFPSHQLLELPDQPVPASAVLEPAVHATPKVGNALPEVPKPATIPNDQALRNLVATTRNPAQSAVNAIRVLPNPATNPNDPTSKIADKATKRAHLANLSAKNAAA